jgi:hypothetical protein
MENERITYEKNGKSSEESVIFNSAAIYDEQ